MKATRDLKELLKKIGAKGFFDKEEISSMMTHVRKILEINGKYKSQHPQINLMCNWMLHTKIQGSLVAARALLAVSKAVHASIKKGANSEEDAENTRLFSEAMKKALGLDDIRSGLRTIFEDLKIPTAILSDSDWDGVQVCILEQITDVPLCFSEEIIDGYTGDEKRKLKMKKIFDEIMALDDERSQLTELAVREMGDSLLLSGKSHDESLKISIQLVRYSK